MRALTLVVAIVFFLLAQLFLAGAAAEDETPKEQNEASADAPSATPAPDDETPREQKRGTFSTVIMTIAVEIVLLGIFVVIALFTCYERATADQALIRSGMGGMKVSLGGSIMRIPKIHEVMRISLETLRLEVQRGKEQAPTTKDNVQVDVTAQLCVKVSATEDDVMLAARTLGTMETEKVKALVETKLDRALRSIAATMDLADLQQKTEDFTDQTQAALKDDLKDNGLGLETFTIVTLGEASKAEG